MKDTDNSQVLTDAAAWAQRLEAGVMTDDEWSTFESWLARSSEHRAVFERIQEVWLSTAVQEHELESVLALAPLPSITGLGCDGRTSADGGSLDLTGMFRGVRGVSWQTGVFLVGVIAMGVALLSNDDQAPQAQVAQTHYGEKLQLRLQEGSIVELSTLTRIEYSYSEAARNVRLHHGEAYFEVERDEKRPFVVSVGESEVRVIGTAFNVKYVNDSLRVSVVTGTVELDSNRNRSPVSITRGYSATKVSDSDVQIDQFDAANELSWRSGFISFDNRSLQWILNELDRYYEQRLVSTVPMPDGDNRFTGIIYIDDFSSVLEQLESLLSADIAYSEKKGMSVAFGTGGAAGDE